MKSRSRASRAPSKRSAAPRRASPKPRRKAVEPTGPVALAADYGIADAGVLKAQLLPLLPAASTIEIDARAVRRIDTASLQVLAAFVRDRRSRGAEVEWRGVSAEFRESVRLLGLAAILGDLPHAPQAWAAELHP